MFMPKEIEKNPCTIFGPPGAELSIIITLNLWEFKALNCSWLVYWHFEITERNQIQCAQKQNFSNIWQVLWSKRTSTFCSLKARFLLNDWQFFYGTSLPDAILLTNMLVRTKILNAFRFFGHKVWAMETALTSSSKQLASYCIKMLCRATSKRSVAFKLLLSLAG